MFSKIQELLSQDFKHSASKLSFNLLNDPAVKQNITDNKKEKLAFFSIISGLEINSPVSVNAALELFKNAEDRNVKILLAYYLGDFYFRQSEYANANEYLEQTDALYFSNALNEKIQFEKGLSYFSLKNFTTAKPFLKSIVQLEKSDYRKDALYYLGFIYFSENFYDDALSQFNSLQNDPIYRKTVPFYLAFIYNQKGETEKAIKTAESYLNQSDAFHTKETIQFLASIYFNKNDYVKSNMLYEKALLTGIVLEPIQRYEMGVGYHELGKFTKAIEQLKPLSIGKDSIAGHSMFYLGDSYLQIGEKSNARNSFIFIPSLPVSENKKEVAALILAKLSLELGFKDQGFQQLNDFILQFPNSQLIGEAKEALLKYYAKTNNFQQAIELLKKIELSKTSYESIVPRIYFGRAMEIINENKYDLVDEYLNEILRLKSNFFYGPALFWKAEIYYRSDLYNESIKTFNEYLKTNAKDLGEATRENAFYSLGYSYFEIESYDKALSFFEKLFSANQFIKTEIKREAILRAADCSFMLKNIQKAKNLYSKIANDPGTETEYASFQLALIEGINNTAEKLRLLKDIETRFPSSSYIPIVTMELADTYISEEEYEKAIPYLEKIQNLVTEDDELLPSSFLKLGVSLYNLEKPDAAIIQFKKLLLKYPASEQAFEAAESAKTIFLAKGKINEYQDFLAVGGRSITTMQKDSLAFQFIQSKLLENETSSVYTALENYKNQFPNGLFITDVLNYQSELFQKEKKWKEAADVLDTLISKGVSKYQEKSYRSAAKIYFFELKDYLQAIRNFSGLLELSNSDNSKLEALRGIVRSYYFLKDWQSGESFAKKLLIMNIMPDDRAYGLIILAYNDQQLKLYPSSNSYFNKVIIENSTILTTESAYQLASNIFTLGNLEESEKAAMAAIEKSGSNDFWSTRSYILLGDIFFKQKDFFNAKATLQSVINNCKISELKLEAIQNLKLIESEEHSLDKKYLK